MPTGARPRSTAPATSPSRFEVEVETVTRTFGDRDSRAAGATPDLSQYVSDSMQTVRPVGHEHREAWLCPHCGAVASFSLEPRPTYRRVSPTHPDGLVRRARGERERGEAQVAASERAAAAAEEANRLRRDEIELRRRELDACTKRRAQHDIGRNRSRERKRPRGRSINRRVTRDKQHIRAGHPTHICR